MSRSSASESSAELELEMEAPERTKATQVDVQASYFEYMEPLATKPPEYGSEGLVVLWEPSYRDDSTPEPVAMAQDFDIVVVHGLYGARRPPWKNPGSGDSSWMSDAGQLDGRKVMSFGYDAFKTLGGRQTRHALGIAAKRLLNDLTAERAKSAVKRSIMFIAHDIGGIIVKYALTLAGGNPIQYGEIFDFTRVIIFYGVPHRAHDYMDMEDRLSRFMFSYSNPAAPSAISATVASIRGLANAIFDINCLFIDLKHIFRSYILSVYADKPESSIDQAFDGLAATLGLPFEIRLPGGVSKAADFSTIEKLLIRVQFQIVVNPLTLGHERALLCIAAPTYSLTTADKDDHPYAWILENEKYISWFNQKRPQLLYIHGRNPVRQAAESIFYDIDKVHLKKNNEVVLFFTFNRWDVRRDSILDMLTSFLAQIIGHFPSLAEFVDLQFERLSLDRSWNDFDLLNWFEYYRLRGEVQGVTCVINHFDECDPVSRKAFLKLFAYIAGVHERPWRVVVTSQKYGALEEELSQWPVLDLDAAIPCPTTPATAERNDRREDIHRLVQRRPELRGREDLVRRELESLDHLDSVRQRLILEHMSAHEDWPSRQTIESTLGKVSEMSTEEVLNKILEICPERKFALTALSWILYSVRPPTTWELATVLATSSGRDVPARIVDDVMWKITKGLAGIVVVESHEIHIKQYRVREILMSKPAKDATCKYPWEGIKDESHALIAKTCLGYLKRPPVLAHIEKVYGEGRSSVMDLPTYCDRTTLCDYAAQFWMLHLSCVPADLDPDLGSQLNPRGVVKAFLDSKQAVQTWSQAYWALANPIKRSQRHFESIYPVLAGLDLAELAEPWRNGNEDISAGLIEACLNGSRKVVHDLLPRVEHSTKALREALVAAGSNGDEITWVDLIDHIRERYKDFPWPNSLLSRAAWLGLDKVAAKLLDLGVPVDPEDSIQRATPLHLVARTGHLNVTTVLLEHKADVNYIGRYGRAALHVTASFGHPMVAKLLVEHGADINIKDEEGMTPLYMACLWGNYTVAGTLISLGADPNIGVNNDTSEPGWYPLIVAAEEAHVECTRALLDGGAEPNIPGIGGTPLRYAATSGLPELCRILIEKGADPNHASIDPPILWQTITAHDNKSRLEIVKILVENHARINVAHTDGTTALWWACWSDDKDMLGVISYLLAHGADVNQQDRTGMAPIHIACRKINVEMVRLLLAKGADIDAANSRQRTPLAFAVESEEITKYLLEEGADPNQDVPGQDQALVYAVMGHHTAVAKLLLEHKATVDPIYDLEWTALALAAAWGFPDLVHLLGDAGADMNHKTNGGRTILHNAMDAATLSAILEFRPDMDVQDTDGNTPLHEVSFLNSLERVKLLVRAGADVNMPNSQGLTPLVRAVQGEIENVDTVSYLLSKGADVNAASPVQGSALHIAAKKRLVEVAEALLAAGADYNLAVSGTAGTPLQSALLACNGSDNEAKANDTVSLLLDAGADPTSPGGRLGSAPAVAAWKAPPSMLFLLLSRGAGVSITDAMGRRVVHIAALRAPDQLEMALDASKDTDAALAQDRTGRTVLHWAAQGGDVACLARVLALTGDEAVNQPDIGGWTPLYWAARGWHSSDRPKMGSEEQVSVIRELLKKGADVRVKSKIGGKEWTPLAIAKHHSASEEVIDLLTPEELKGKEAHDEKKEDPHGEHKEHHGHEGKKVHHTTDRRLNTWDYYCDYCLYTILGFKYSCKTCSQFDLCYKCHHSRSHLHQSDHVFEEIGPEYEVASASDTSSSRLSSDVPSSEESESEDEKDSPES